MTHFDGVHAFGYNSADSEPIWMKFRALWVYSRGWPHQILGAICAVEPGKILFFLPGKQCTILPISCPRSFRKFEHNTSISVVMNLFGTQLWKFSRKGLFFKKKMQTDDFFQCLATSGHHDSAMIVDQQKFITRWSLYGMSSFHFWQTDISLFNDIRAGNVRPSVGTSVHPSVRTYVRPQKVCPISMKFGVYIQVDEWCMTVCRMTRLRSRSRRLWSSKNCTFPTPISSTIYNGSWQMTTNS